MTDDATGDGRLDECAWEAKDELPTPTPTARLVIGLDFRFGLDKLFRRLFRAGSQIPNP